MAELELEPRPSDSEVLRPLWVGVWFPQSLSIINTNLPNANVATICRTLTGYASLVGDSGRPRALGLEGPLWGGGDGSYSH